ncbi:hypothetical protein [Phaeobacter inhibens]|nr:hypothetical protein [Phaeobacter inhibens]WHP66828.1 hypothetical protein QMZ01_09620 [Phaeobacter inhibens]
MMGEPSAPCPPLAISPPAQTPPKTGIMLATSPNVTPENAIAFTPW